MSINDIQKALAEQQIIYRDKTITSAQRKVCNNTILKLMQQLHKAQNRKPISDKMIL